MDAEQVDLRSFVARCVSGEKQNDSVDSGVCPSPDEGYQNYDEAFPPLSTSLVDSELNVVVPAATWQTAKRPADPSVYSFAPSPINSFIDNSIQQHLTNNPIASSLVDRSITATVGDSESPIHAGATPIKRPKLQALNDITNRPLRSCPDLPSQKSFLQINSGLGNGNGAGGVGGVTFCCPMVNAASNVTKTAQASPQFVVPKCFKVGSWPMRSSEKACKHANDVPFWSCSEWFCTVHKGVEFGLLSAKVGGMDSSKCLAAQQQTTTNSSSSNVVNNNSNFNNIKDPATNQQINNNPSCCPSSLSEVSGDCMFDAPRFILHIINENENIKEGNDFGMTDDCKEQLLDNSLAAAATAQDGGGGNLNVDDWTMTAATNVGLPEFMFMPYQNNNLQPNVRSSFAPQEVGFCLPKFDLPSIEQQCKIQSSCTTTASPFSKLSEVQLQQQMVSNHSSYANLNVINNDASSQLNFQPSQQQQQQTMAQTVSVPISPNTHFVPIRSESMEDAYYPKPGFDENFLSLIDDADYYVYRDQAGDVLGRNGTIKIVHTGDSSVNCAANSNGLSEGDELVSAGSVADKNVGNLPREKINTSKQTTSAVRRSLPLKFKALLPVKMVQTENEQQQQNDTEDDEYVGNDGNGNHSLESEFEIWACKPVSINGNFLSSLQWPESFDCQSVISGNSGLYPLFTHNNNNNSTHESSPFTVVRPCSEKNKRSQQHQNEGEVESRMLEIWQQEDEHDEDLLLQFVSNISLISPLEATTSSATAAEY